MMTVRWRGLAGSLSEYAPTPSARVDHQPVGQRCAEAHHIDRDEARHRIGDRLPRVAVDNVIECDTCVALEQLHGEVGYRADQGEVTGYLSVTLRYRLDVMTVAARSLQAARFTG